MNVDSSKSRALHTNTRRETLRSARLVAPRGGLQSPSCCLCCTLLQRFCTVHAKALLQSEHDADDDEAAAESLDDAGEPETVAARRPSSDFFVALNRRLESDSDREAEVAAAEATDSKRPSRDFVSGVVRRATRAVAKEENPVIESLMTDPFGRAPDIPSSLDVPDPLCAAAAPMRGMRPRNELLIDERKERARERRRYVFDFDYWANMRSTSRHLFNILSIPSSVIYRSILVPTLLFTGLAWVTTLGLEIPAFLLPLPTWTHFFPIAASPVPITLTGSAFSLLLTFSTNNSAKRFNEARVMWGQLLQRARDLGRQAITFFPAKAVDERASLARWAMVFTLALKCHLRPGQDLAEKASYLLTGAELRLLMTAEHRPLLCLQVMSHIIEAADASQFEKMQMHANLTEFEDILGGCERLLRTPIPVSYGRHSTRFQVIWFTAFPILMQPTLGDAVVPTTALLAFALFGIGEIGLEIEEPFGILPLEVICAKTIRDLTSLVNNEEAMWDIATEIYDYPDDCGIFRRQG